MLPRLSVRSLLLAVLLIIPAACSLTGDGDRPTPVPTSFIATTSTPFIVTATPGPTTAAQPTPVPRATTAPVVVQPCAIPPGWIAYRVAAGDTLSAIARRTGTTTTQLTNGNCLSNPNDIEVGQTLYIPPTVVITSTPVVTAACTLAPRLAVGGQGRVLPGTPNALRSLPNRGSTSVVIGEIPGGGVFSVLAGPQCADGYYWWQVSYEGVTGWTAEGQGSTYWLEPVTTCAPAPRLAVGVQGRVLPGTSNALRSLPNRGSTSVVIGEIPGGGVFSVLAGPQCADGHNWWQVNYNGVIGWTAEGQGSTYWVEPQTTCALPTRLQAGRTGRVTPGLPNTLRSQPGRGSNSVVIGEIPGGGLFRVIQGPHCVDGYNWWQVNYSGTIGWTGEGQGSTYWTEPVKCSQSLVSQLLPNTVARVTPGLPNRLRLTPGSTGSVITQIPGGASFTIVGGPQCGAEGWLWWQVNYNGTIGWTAEGDATTYWLEPIP